MTPIERGIAYATKGGLHVLPLSGKIPCIPSEKKGGIGKGVWDATTDLATIERWIKEYPNANIGVHPGPSGLVVLDFDTKDDNGVRGARPNGLDTLEELRMLIPEIDDAWIVETPSGGFHYYFSAPEGLDLKNPVRIMRGLDIRFNGTFVVAPPSTHPEFPGVLYKWLKKVGDRPPVIPNAILERLKIATVERRQSAKADIASGEPIHERHTGLHAIGVRYRKTGLQYDELYALLSLINQKRCAPEPLPDSEIVRLCETLDGYDAKDNYVNDAVASAGTFERSTSANNGKKKPKFRNASSIKPMPVEWLMPGFFATAKFNLLWGMEGRGKSYLTIGMAAAISRGRPLPGVTELEAAAKGPGSVVFLAYEDDPSDTLVPRLMKCGADLSRIHIMHYEDGQISNKDIDGLALSLAEIPDLRMVVIDPITSFSAGVSDTDETSVRTVVDPLIRLAFGKPYAIIGVKHSNKKSDAAIADRTSGARAWTGAARCVVLAGHDNEKEQEQFHTFGGAIATKANLAGRYEPLAYEIKDGVFKFMGTDPTLTPERLFPAKSKDKDSKDR